MARRATAKAPAPEAGREGPAPLVFGALLLLFGAAIYANSLHGAFVYDDQYSILENEGIRRLWPPWEALSAPDESPVAGRPIASLSLAINYALGGLEVRGYHAVNIALHLLAALALFSVVRRTLLGGRMAERFAKHAGLLAFACALLWMAHPLQTEAVNYITQRTESLMGLFYLLTLYCAIRSRETAPRGRRFALGAICCCALGMASKESMVTAPIAVVLYDFIFHPAPLRTLFRERGRLYGGLAATWVLLIALMATGPRSESVGLALKIGPLEYAMNQCRVLLVYLRSAFWPHPLTFDYGAPEPMTWAQALPGAVVILALFGLSLWAVLKRRPAGYAGAWCFIALAPTSTVVPIITEAGADRRMYLPLAGLVTLIVLGAYAALPRLRIGSLRGRLAAGAAAVLVLAIAEGALTRQRNLDYASETAIWRSAVETRPDNPRALGNLGKTLMDQGRDGEAETFLRRALEIEPSFARAQYNLGVLEVKKGRIAEAADHFDKAVRSKPELIEAQNNLGLCLMQAGKFEEAAARFEEALRRRPDYAKGHFNLGEALLRLGRAQEAKAQYEEALRLQPGWQEAIQRIRAIQ